MKKKFSFVQRKMLASLLMCLACLSILVSAQNTDKVASIGRRIRGVVIDAEGNPLTGATLLVAKGGQSWGGIVDSEGNFELILPMKLFADEKPNVDLIVSFIGYQKRTVKIEPKKDRYRVIMSAKDEELDEVIVTGYQNLDPRKNTSAITSLKMDDILTPGMTSVTQALEGRVPDMIFMQNSGEVGATARLRVRGTSTLVGNREPLWVLDGIVLQDPVDVTNEQLNDPDYINYIGNAISGINPEDIDRIDVLKDASATALYGTRASNGVIVVTTKKGHIGKPTIRYSTQFKLTSRPRYSDRNIWLMNSQERVAFGKDLCDLHYAFPENMTMVGYEGAYYKFQTGAIPYDEFLNQVRTAETVNTDWFNLLTTDALTHSHTVSLSGGTEAIRYYASVGYNRENDVIRTQYAERYNGSLTFTADITKGFTANVRINANVQKRNHLPSDIDALNYAYNTTRALPAFNADGSYSYYQRHAYSIGSNKGDSFKYNYNIMNEMENSSDENTSDGMIGTLDLNYKFQTFLDISATASYSRNNSQSGVWFGEGSNYAAQLRNAEVGEMPLLGEAGRCDMPYGGVYNTRNSQNESFTGRLQVNYHQGFGKDNRHLVAANLGYEVNSSNSNSIADDTRGYLKDRGMQYVKMTPEDLDKYPYYKTWLAEGHRRLTSGKNNVLSGYLSLTYTYHNFLTFNANGRFDASNKFGKRSNDKLLPVWSTSFNWNIKESLFKDTKWINSLRIRASYGKTGNMLDNQKPNMLIRKGTMNSFYNEYTSSVDYFPNPNLRWEQTNQVNSGFEISLFDSRLNISSDFYYKKTKDAFASVNISTVNGLAAYMMNNGNIENRGYSVSVSGYPIKTKDWSLYLSTSFSAIKNKALTKTSDVYQYGDYLNGTAIVDGEAIGTFYSYEYRGLSPVNGAPVFDDYSDRRHLLEGKLIGDVVQTVMMNTGSREPSFTESLYVTLKWKQLSLNMNFICNLGSKVRLFDLYSPILDGVTSDSNVRKEFLDRWRIPGDEYLTNIPSLISPSDPNYSDYRTHWSSVTGSPSVKFANNLWEMYDKSDLRVVSGDYLKMSNLTVQYDIPKKILNGTPFQSLRLNFSTANVFTITSSKLKGQDPTQANFIKASLSQRPSYTFGLNVSF